MKTTMNKAFSLILAALLLLTVIPLWAQADTIFYDSASKLYFRVIGTNPNLVEVGSHPESGYSGSYTIPGTVTYQGVTYTVTKIGAYAFKESDVTSVVIPNTVTEIGTEAFSLCTELTSLNIPDSVTRISAAAIQGTGLTSLTVPASVTYIADAAIGYNAWADVLVLYDEPKYIGIDAFLETDRVAHKLVAPNSVNCSNFLSYWPLQIENNVDIAGFYHVKFCANNSTVLEFSIDRSTDSSGTGATSYTGKDMAATLAELGPGVYTVYAQAACDGYGASAWTKGNTFTYGTDTEAPTISNVKVTRVSAAQAIVEFTSSEKGVFYSAWANNSLDTYSEGELAEEGTNSFFVDLAAGNQAQDIQLMVKDYMGNESTVVIATAPEYVIPFAVDFDTNGYGTAPQSQTVNLGGKVTKPADPIAEGYTFGGWYKDAACTTAWNFETDVVNEDMILYAAWLCTLTYDGNGYDIRTTPSDASGKTYQVGSSANVAQGYHPNSKLQFQSWNTKPDGSGTKYVINNGLLMTQNTTLYAQWKCRVGVVGNWANSGCEVSINSLGLSVEVGGTASFTVTLMNGWEKTADFAVTANNIPLVPSEISPDGRTMTYTMTNVQENQFLRIQGTAKKEQIAFTDVSMNLGNSLTMYFKVNAEDVPAGCKAVITKNYADGREPVVTEIAQKDWLTEGDLYSIPVENIAAKEMSDIVSVVIQDGSGNAISEVKTGSVRAYAMMTLSTSTDAKLLTLMAELLNYGAAAQQQFNYGTSDLANAKMNATHQSYATADTSILTPKANRGDAVKVQSFNMVLESNLMLNLKYNTTEVTQDMTAKVSYTTHAGTVVSYETGVTMGSDGYIWVSLSSLAAADINTIATVEIVSNGEVISTTQINMAVAVAIDNGTTPAMTAMSRYCVAAYNFFH